MANRRSAPDTAPEPETPDTPVVSSDPAEPVTQTGDEYQTQGRTRLETPAGYQFAPSDTDLPVVTQFGVLYTKEQAEKILAESFSVDGRVRVALNQEG